MKNWTIAASAAALTLAVMGSAKADDLVFTLKNGTNSVLNAFYTSPVGEV